MTERLAGLFSKTHHALTTVPGLSLESSHWLYPLYRCRRTGRCIPCWQTDGSLSVRFAPLPLKALSRLTATRKVGHVLFNPAAQNILASSSGDYTVKIWDIEKGKDRLSLKHGEIVQSLSFSADGALLVTTSRDKKLRIWDVRQEKPAHEVPVIDLCATLELRLRIYRATQEQRTVVPYGWVNMAVSPQLASHG
jgi:WD40 repeat protein